jgi:putative membrane protein
MRDRILVFIAAAAIVLVFGPVLIMSWWMVSPGDWMMRGGAMGRGMMGWERAGYGRSWIPMVASSLVFLVLLGLVALGAYYLFSNHGAVNRDGDRSLEILRERFAKGEIAEEQFQKMKKHLQE